MALALIPVINLSVSGAHGGHLCKEEEEAPEEHFSISGEDWGALPAGCPWRMGYHPPCPGLGLSEWSSAPQGKDQLMDSPRGGS